MKNLKKNLEAIANELKALTKKVEKLTETVRRLEKTRPSAKPQAKTKQRASTTRGKKTATDQVIGIIQRAENGIDVPTLAKKTGFDEKKIRNIVFRAFKRGMIKKSGRGIYIGA